MIIGDSNTRHITDHLFNMTSHDIQHLNAFTLEQALDLIPTIREDQMTDTRVYLLVGTNNIKRGETARECADKHKEITDMIVEKAQNVTVIELPPFTAVTKENRDNLTDVSSSPPPTNKGAHQKEKKVTFGPTNIKIIPARDEGHLNRPRKNKRTRIRKTKQITIITVNVRGIKSKVISIESLLKATKASIALISETRLDKNQQINIKGYNWIGKNRNRNGGGVGILIKNTIAQQTKEDTTADEHPDLETKWITLETRPKNIAKGVFYGPQEGERIDKTKKNLQHTWNTHPAKT